MEAILRMPVPASCFECKLSDYVRAYGEFYCFGAKKYVGHRKMSRHPDCPLEIVEERGKFEDGKAVADRLIEKLKSGGFTRQAETNGLSRKEADFFTYSVRGAR